ncbi:MAG TPA: RnfABCDGE type electron transport complex subunit D [Candidatus Norongarragalinales archaeon]|jgi:Na+-translocating ferredoxin:NAD+ oxidoreductase RnfD subunit|nr:RnfABCDGE type electron transport complex subunit D [Candidatus Norongarragalinales archaeon]
MELKPLTKDPRDLMLVFLALWFVLGLVDNGLKVLPTFLTAVIVAVVADVALAKYAKNQNRLPLPKSALISGFLIGGILSPETALWIVAVASIIAILSKYVIQYQGSHVFNPANLGILFAAAIFGAPVVWWFASPTLGGMLPVMGTLLLVLVLGLVNSFNVERLYATAGFLIAEFATLMAFGLPASSALSLLNVFIACFMIVEPQSSPWSIRNMSIFGVVCGVLAAVFLQVPDTQLFSDNLALAVANVFGVLLVNFWPE